MTEASAYFDEVFADQRLMAILRGLPPAETVSLCQQAWANGIKVVEVPIQSTAAVASFQAAVGAGREHGRAVGVGTVLDVEQVDLAVRHGATGGVDAENARDFLEAGARVAAVGSALMDPEQLQRLGELLTT